MTETGETKVLKALVESEEPLTHQQLGQLTKIKDIKGLLSKLKSRGLVDNPEENQWVILDAGKGEVEQLLNQPPPLQPPEEPVGKETEGTVPSQADLFRGIGERLSSETRQEKVIL